MTEKKWLWVRIGLTAVTLGVTAYNYYKFVNKQKEITEDLKRMDEEFFNKKFK